jgi:hypothetical protein
MTLCCRHQTAKRSTSGTSGCLLWQSFNVWKEIVIMDQGDLRYFLDSLSLFVPSHTPKPFCQFSLAQNDF